MDKQIKKILRPVIGITLSLLVLLGLAPFFISLEEFRPGIEAEATLAVGQPVSIGKLEARLLPRPKLLARQLVIGRQENPGLVIRKVSIYPQLTSLWGERLTISKISAEDVEVTGEFIGAVSSRQANSTDGQGEVSFSLARVKVNNLLLKGLAAQPLGPYDLDAGLADNLLLKTIRVTRTDNSLQLDILKKPADYDLALKASGWQPPLGPAWQFDSLVAVGKLHDNGISITTFKAGLYRGEISGKLDINWVNAIQVKGTVDSKQLDVEPFLALLLKEPVIAGRLDGKASYEWLANRPDRPVITSELEVRDGKIYNADLERATELLSSEEKKGDTPFSSLSAEVDLRDGITRIDDLELQSEVLEAKGKVRIDTKQQLSGLVDVGITRTGSLVSVPIEVGGTLDEPDLKPTKEAMVGGAVGTGLLGPGVGTAVGVKAGSFIKGVKDFFTGDEEKKPPTKTTRPGKATSLPPADDDLFGTED